MILLDNYSKINTFINITADGYCIIDAKNVEGIENGEGGFSEDGELLGLYINDDKLYFQYNNKSYETKPNEIKCTNEILMGGNRNFIVKINDNIYSNNLIGYVGPIYLTQKTPYKAPNGYYLNGLTTGTHLHLSIKKDGKAVNPLDYL